MECQIKGCGKTADHFVTRERTDAEGEVMPGTFEEFYCCEDHAWDHVGHEDWFTMVSALGADVVDESAKRKEVADLGPIEGP